jgi:hypothetical protein
MLKRRPNGDRTASQLFIMMGFVSSDGLMADVYCVEEQVMSVCEHGSQEMYVYRHIGKHIHIRQFVRLADKLSREVENQNLTISPWI